MERSGTILASTSATLYDGRENSVAAVHLSRLSASPSLADVGASIAPDRSTLSRNGLIAAANEALRVQRSLEHEVAALQETMLSMRNQSQINSSAISGGTRKFYSTLKLT